MRPRRKFARRSAPKGRVTKPDARGARHQHSGFRSHGSNRKPARLLSRPCKRDTSRSCPARSISTSCEPRCKSQGSPSASKPYKASRLINELKELAENTGSLPRVELSRDPTDAFLLALSEAGKADYLVTRDKDGLLDLDRHKATRIISASDFAALFA